MVARISILVIDETLWALGKFYGIEEAVFIPELLKILSLRNIRVIEINKSVVIRILEKMLSEKIDFTDLYLLNVSEGNKIVTFDKKLLKLASN
ncbi:MAG: PIN domain-containing protein [Patescibacteria group bacterium]